MFLFLFLFEKVICLFTFDGQKREAPEAKKQPYLQYNSTYTNTSNIMSSDLIAVQQLDNKMEHFHQNFKSSIQTYKTLLLNSRNEYASNYEDLIAKQNELKKKIEKLNEDEAKVKELLSNELNTLNDARAKINELTSNEAALVNSKNSIYKKIQILTEQIELKKSELNSSKKDLDRNLQKDLNLVKLYESFLGLKIDSVKDDVIRFVFFNLLQNDLDRSFEVVLDLSDNQGNYRIQSLSYDLPEIEVNNHLNDLNHSRNLILFLKNIRTCFLDHFRG